MESLTVLSCDQSSSENCSAVTTHGGVNGKPKGWKKKCLNEDRRGTQGGKTANGGGGNSVKDAATCYWEGYYQRKSEPGPLCTKNKKKLQKSEVKQSGV